MTKTRLKATLAELQQMTDHQISCSCNEIRKAERAALILIEKQEREGKRKWKIFGR
jgi:hypothetical protein